MKKIIVAIDGFSSCGKSTIAKALAKHAGYRYVDTGAMYRSVALYTIEKKPAEMAVEPFLEQHIGELNIDFSVQPDGSQHTLLNGRDVEALIRTLEVGNMASQVSTIGFVRRAMVAQQQAMGREGGIVMDVISARWFSQMPNSNCFLQLLLRFELSVDLRNLKRRASIRLWKRCLQTLTTATIAIRIVQNLRCIKLKMP